MNRCDKTDGYINGGAIYICVEALKKGIIVAAICQIGFENYRPRCATDFANQQINGHMITGPGGDCPMEAEPPSYKKRSIGNSTLANNTGEKYSNMKREQWINSCFDARNKK